MNKAEEFVFPLENGGSRFDLVCCFEDWLLQDSFGYEKSKVKKYSWSTNSLRRIKKLPVLLYQLFEQMHRSRCLTQRTAKFRGSVLAVSFQCCQSIGSDAFRYWATAHLFYYAEWCRQPRTLLLLELSGDLQPAVAGSKSIGRRRGQRVRMRAVVDGLERLDHADLEEAQCKHASPQWSECPRCESSLEAVI